jgi:hypothetical protein
VRHTRDEGHGVLATILGGLEEIGLNAGEGCANWVSGSFETRQKRSMAYFWREQSDRERKLRKRCGAKSIEQRLAKAPSWLEKDCRGKAETRKKQKM